MSTSQKRDAEMDRLLRTVLQPASQEAAGECPDAGVLAAFVEGSLTATEQSGLDSHIATCGRCQKALEVLSHDMPNEEIAAPATGWFTWVTQPRLRWLVPISAVATIAVVFFATRPLIAPGPVPAGEVAKMAQAPVAPEETPSAGVAALREGPAALPKKDAAASAVAPSPGRDRARESSKAEQATELAAGAAPPREAAHDKKAVEPTAQMLTARVASEEKTARPGAPAAPPPPAGAQIAAAPQTANIPVAADAAGKQQAAEVERAVPAAAALRRDALNVEADLAAVSAPGGHVLWRFGRGGRLSRSGDAGSSWHVQASGVTTDLLAGAAPSPATCWIVGAAGTVLLTTDGERWERRPFPLTVDLVAVSASSARAAIVTTRDGRRFETLDAGLTWSFR